jgi:hypothetical protein
MAWVVAKTRRITRRSRRSALVSLARRGRIAAGAVWTMDHDAGCAGSSAHRVSGSRWPSFKARGAATGDRSGRGCPRGWQRGATIESRLGRSGEILDRRGSDATSPCAGLETLHRGLQRRLRRAIVDRRTYEGRSKFSSARRAGTPEMSNSYHVTVIGMGETEFGNSCHVTVIPKLRSAPAPGAPELSNSIQVIV